MVSIWVGLRDKYYILTCATGASSATTCKVRATVVFCIRLFDEYADLANATANEQESLKATVKTLEHEIAIWRRAAMAGDDVQDGMALCVVDGTRTMFSTPYLNRGFAGGRYAAERLLSCIQERLTSSKDEFPNFNVHNISISVYCAKAQLVESLSDRAVCDTSMIDAFLTGFSGTSALINVIDVADQESVDSKVIGQWSEVFVLSTALTLR